MSATLAERRWLLAVRMMAAAGVWSLGLVLAAVLLPAYPGDTTTAGVATLTQQTLVQNEGLWSLAVVLVPLLACAVVAVSMVQRRRQDVRWAIPVAWAAIGVLAVAAILAITSVGGFMVPVVVLLALSVRMAPGWGDVRSRPVAADAAANGSGELATRS